MNIKPSTRAYAERKDVNFITKDSGIRTQSATDMQRLGEENLGDVLNKIADPQWIDPAKKMRTVGDKNLDKDAFMKLMLTQMKHQDPTNPMQAHEMAAQLAAFSSVEQLQNLNTTVETLSKAQAPIQQFETLNLIGKAVAGDSSDLVRVKGDQSHSFQYRLPKDAEDIQIAVKNSRGEVVRSFKVKQQKAGPNAVDWNGQDERGVEQPPGEYRFTIEAVDKLGQRVAAETQFDGLITGVQYTGEGPLLMMGNRTVKFSDVRKIVDPQIKTEDQKTPEITKNERQDLKVSGDASDTVPNNLDQIAMSREMLNRVEKQAESATGI